MHRSLRVLGVVVVAVGAPSLALANGSGALQAGSSGGPSFETSVTVDTPPLNGKCPAIMQMHGTTTLLNPDGKHFHATAHFQVGVASSTQVPLDFTTRTTQTWTASYADPDEGMIAQPAIFAEITDYTGATTQELVATSGTFQVGCQASTGPGSKPTIAPVTPAMSTCNDYRPDTLVVTATSVSRPGPLAMSLYNGKSKADVAMAADVIKHFTNMCSILDSSLFYFEGAGARNEPNWGKCVAYDGKSVAIVNDATGWLVKAGDRVIVRVPLEADARTLGEAVKRRSNDCSIGEGTEAAANVLHYLH